MLTIQARQQFISQALITQYQHIDTSTIGHLTDTGYVKQLKRLCGNQSFVGNIVTVKLPNLDGSAIREALLICEAGDVLVIDMPEADRACWGELRTIAALTKGLAGVITSACITDFNAIQKLDLPIFAKGTSSITTRNLQQGGEVNTNITLNNIEVRPGDLAIGDSDGLFILSPEQAESLLEKAQQKQLADANRQREMWQTLEATKARKNLC